MTSAATNPLTAYFRQPAIYIKLPSNGQWWGEGSIDLPANGEIPVYPMTARDEITIKTPDALMNGQGVVDVIQSCCPNIKNAWKMPSVDVDMVLLAVRVATFGSSMDIRTRCSHCNHSNEHEVNLSPIIDNIVCPSFNKTVDYRDIRIKVRPQHYFEVNRANTVSYEEQKILNLLANDDLEPETKAAELRDSMRRLVDIGVESCVNSTEYIELPTGDRVSSREYIKEFYTNAENEVITRLQSHIAELAKITKIPDQQVQCEECQGVYQTELEFDYASFFAKGF